MAWSSQLQAILFNVKKFCMLLTKFLSTYLLIFRYILFVVCLGGEFFENEPPE
jgi:hypothetical protein